MDSRGSSVREMGRCSHPSRRLQRAGARISVVAIVGLFAAAVPQAEACSCREQGPPCEAYWTTEIIFRGRAESTGRPADRKADPRQHVTTRFTVLEPFKGVGGATVDVRTPTGPASCALRFSKGREYVVHASRVSGVIATSSCSRTRRIERAAEDLAFARSIAAGGVPLGRISGRVLLQSRELWTRGYRTRPMRDVRVLITRGDLDLELLTDRAGAFVATGLDAGAYWVALLDLPGRFRVEVDRAPVELRDGRGCAEINAHVYPDGRVLGRVIDSTGKPVRGLTVDLTVRTDSDRASSRGSPDRLQAVTGDDGSYELTEVPPGRFVVGINTLEYGTTSRDARVFYPGVLRPADAALVDVPAGARVKLQDFVVPESVRFVEIAGVIVDTSRVPVEGARVYLRGSRERDFILTAPVVTDLNGRFTIAGLLDQEYLLFAERPRPGNSRWLDSTGLLPVTATPTHPRLTLTLRSQH